MEDQGTPQDKRDVLTQAAERNLNQAIDAVDFWCRERMITVSERDGVIRFLGSALKNVQDIAALNKEERELEALEEALRKSAYIADISLEYREKLRQTLLRKLKENQ